MSYPGHSLEGIYLSAGMKSVYSIAPADLAAKYKYALFSEQTFRTVSCYLCFIFVTESLSSTGGCPSGVMVKAMDCRIVVSEFVLQSRYYVHFRANTHGKGMNPLVLLAMG